MARSGRFVLTTTGLVLAGQIAPAIQVVNADEEAATSGDLAARVRWEPERPAEIPIAIPTGEDGDTTLPLYQQVEYRKNYGLEPTVAAAEAAAKSADVTVVDGVPLTAFEARELQEQLALEDTLLELDSVLNRDWRGAYAGSKIDHVAGGTITVWATDALPSKVVDELAGHASVELIRVTNSLVELEKRYDEISAAFERENYFVEGAQVGGLATNLELNRVEILLEPVDAKLAEAVLARFDAPDVGVRIAAFPKMDATAGNTSNHNLGAQYTYNRYPNGTLNEACSTAFPVKVGLTGNEGVLTDAHCSNDALGYIVSTAPPDNYPIGNVIRVAGYPQNSAHTTDVSVVAYHDMLPKIYYLGSGDDWRVVKFAWSNGIATGIGVRTMAAKTNQVYLDSSGVNDFDITIVDGSRVWNHFQTGSLCYQSGDSGSPVFTLDSNAKVAAGGISYGTTHSAAGCQSGEEVTWQRSNRAIDALNTGSGADIYYLTGD